MKISASTVDSELRLMTELNKFTDSGASLIQIRTREPLRAAVALRQSFLGGAEPAPYTEWDITNGFRHFTSENFPEHLTPGDLALADFVRAFEEPMKQLRKFDSPVNSHSGVVHYFAYLNPHPFLEGNPYAVELLQQYAAILPRKNVCILLITPEMSLKGVPIGTVLVADLATPTAPELESVLRSMIEEAQQDTDSYRDGCDLEEEDYMRLSHLGLGLTKFEFETFTALALVDGSEAGDTAIGYGRLSIGIARGKTEVVKQSDILELISSESMENVGGMARLKDWIKDRSKCFSDEAKAFGIEPPKGAAVIGIPGTGKSLLAKAVAQELGVPAVRLDFGRVFSKFVGDSESRVRSALTMVESMAPVVLFVDEIDKGLGGAGGSAGDGGASSRVLGSFLTWLQECKAPVFTIVTANRVGGLPPELLRRGRFDGIFAVGLPDEDERLEVLDIHLRKRGHSVGKLKGNVAAFKQASTGYVPAEIESAVKDALIAAFNSEVALSIDHIVTALGNMVPMSRSHKAQIDQILEWAETNATPVNYKSGAGARQLPATQTIGGREVVVPTRRIRNGRGR